MKIITQDSSFLKLRAAVWDEVDNPKGTVQIAHGLVEHHGRYKELANFLNQNRYVVFCNDHLGHGLHIQNGMQKGYFSDEDGYENVVNQFGEMNAFIRKNYPLKKHFLLGHSLGTAISLSFLKRNVAYDGVVLSAPFLLDPIMSFLQGLLLWPEYKFFGKKYYSKQMEEATTKRNNSFFKPNRTTHDYLSRDKERVDNYISDPNCGFENTTQLWRDLKDGISGLHSKQSLEKIDQETIFCLLSGDNDPINSKGKQAEKIHHSLLELGMKSELKIFKGMRHEPFNELGRKKVYEYILNFFNNS
ncbi:MAG: alpha/beta fold hydrolase [Gammaproteobacteria bacterium]|uniref:Alpha/beta fold hydrolase n=1 Tax=SAR86 cluster bacterium TaxID=2030880 RepID=A0A520N1I2_9GAMM|nr:hypothetical protein [Gammaproteobacteria bacterium]MBA4729538.1 alpha/beta fold hydrolase [SAR86 cluster bacterium]RPG34869.1 MAG: alpha/beta fold hydrolase [Gammaproteobacteria bacterium TMED193]RZO27295.1 MAG: alpha/beta fold hydrolase [SAR86 cluster bacterium]|tara:strand:- start:115 stop:1020 length:906 start_codon:yes stop_codon:yes gene_type:complete